MAKEFLGAGDKGAHYHRCDFQVHSPRDRQWKGDACVTDEERAQYAASLIAACREKGLDAIAVTDHHDMAFVKYVREAAAQETDAEGNELPDRERIVVFPGIELTLAVPCQAILILDADFEDNRFDSVLTALAVNPAPGADAKTAQTERLETIDSFKLLKTKLDEHSWLKDRYIIFPNVSGEGKFSLLRNGMAPKYKDMPCVGGYLDGSKSGLKPGTLNIVGGKEKAWGHKRIACIQTSDNRRADHADLGNHSSWIKWANPTAEALRQACLAQESRIADDAPNLPTVVITSISVQNSAFLGPVELSFNPQYNALIGGRGTGKSTILEYLRWALCDQPPASDREDTPDYQARRTRLIDGTLKQMGATVDVSFTVNGVPHQVRRSSKDGSTQIKVGEDELRPCSESEVRTLLPIQAYSQKQLSNVSVRLDELGRFIRTPIQTELGSLQRKIEEQETKLRKSFSTRQRQKTIQRDIGRIQLEVRSYQEQANQIRTSLAGLSDEDRQLLELGPYFDRAEQAVEMREVRLEAIKDRIADFRVEDEEVADEQVLVLPEGFPNRERVDALISEYDALIESVEASLGSVVRRIDEALSAGEGSTKSVWDAQLEAYRLAYDEAVERSSTHRDQMGQLKSLEARVGDLQRELSRLNDEVKSYQKAVEAYQLDQEKLHEYRQQRDALIQTQCDALTESSGAAIRAQVQRYADAERFSSMLKSKLSGSNIRTAKLDQVIGYILDAEDPHRAWEGVLEDLEGLASLNLDAEVADQMPDSPFLSDAGATAGDCEKLSRKLDPEDWLALSLTEIESKPKFEYRSREGEYIEFSNASSGQQATALLRTLLNQSGPPLLIDQPEEDLDNPVMQEIVEQIWAAKKRRQIIFVSHNANLVVNGDAELVAWCEYRKAGDQSGGKIAGEGAIDIPAARDAIKRIMEGGEAAFNLRREKYGF
ncbi:AAA family ATPase [Aliiroseovarius sp. Z3]|uniref:TrlF family AAA-like ATPase n=1 Tax=Aliiroseovarius sp. Z3 TaxID=2811402 RepID=UPI0023B21013|nr:AAA family ATPase [Aliiroseovarius sp. Z3]MDE9450436.1 AAA family ATPase [Aliiroseovarius sp. Z3]